MRLYPLRLQLLLCRLAAEDLLRQESVGVAQGGQQPRVEVQQLVADQVLEGVCGELRLGLGRELRLRGGEAEQLGQEVAEAAQQRGGRQRQLGRGRRWGLPRLRDQLRAVLSGRDRPADSNY